MNGYEERWYWCDCEDKIADRPEPDWSKVPEEKRDTVRERWFARNSQVVKSRWQLWGPQIPLISQTTRVTVRAEP